MSKRTWLGVGASILALFGMHSSVNAQSTTPAPGRSAAEEDVVIITAEKRAQNLQDVPLAVTAFTDKMRDQVGISTVQDIASFTPGLGYQTGLDRIYLRGIGRSTNNQASDGGTAIYADGVYTSSTYAAATPSIFIDRIEVLRGPQGTLYGRNSIGGAINVISKRPSDDFTAEVRGQVGSFDRYVAEGRISGPIVEQLRYSLTASHIEQGEGYYENAAGLGSEGEDGYKSIIEGQLEADFTENLRGWVRYRSSLYDYSPRNGGSGAPFWTTSVVPSGAVVPGGGWGIVNGLDLHYNGAAVPQNPTITTGDVRAFVSDTRSHQTVQDAYDVAGELSWDVGDVNLKYVTGAVRYNFERITDFDGSNVNDYLVPVTLAGGAFNNPTCAVPVGSQRACMRVIVPSVNHYIEDKRWWSHELNLSSTDDGPLQWLAGVYYYNEFYDNPSFYPSLQPQALNPVGGPPNPDSIIYTTRVRGEGESYAGFGQVDWEFIPKLKVTGGLRYTHDKKEGAESTRQICFGLGFGSCPLLQIAGSAATAGDVTAALISHTQPAGALSTPVLDPLTGFYSRPYAGSWQATTGTLGLQWDPSEDTMVYAKYSRGYKAGGFNVGTINAQIRTDAEMVDAYEIGVKARPLDSLTTNVSVFYYDYADRQTPIFVIPTTGPARTEFVNVPKSISQGAELEATWYATEDFRVLFNYSYLDAHVEEGCCYIDGVDTLAVTPGSVPAGPAVGTNQPQNVAGQQLPNSPKNRVTVNGVYTFHLPGDSSLDLSATYIWRDMAYGQFFNRAHHVVPEWDQVDLRASWNDPSGRFKVIAFGRNVLDENGYDIAVPTNRGTAAAPVIYTTYGLTPPRTYGVELQAKF